MNTDHNALDQIALTLTKHFDSLYYVSIETGHYCEYTSGKMLRSANIPLSGNDFLPKLSKMLLDVFIPKILKWS